MRVDFGPFPIQAHRLHFPSLQRCPDDVFELILDLQFFQRPHDFTDRGGVCLLRRRCFFRGFHELFRSFHGLHGLHRLGLLVVHCFRPTRLSRAAGLSVSVGLRFGWGGSFRRHGFHRHGFASTQKTRRGAACIDRGPLRSILYGGLP